MTNFISYQTFGNTDLPALIILHGLFGEKQNLNPIAQALSEWFHVVTYDARNHGDSFHASTHSFEDQAQDLLNLSEELGLKSFYLLGHSMGGKTAMLFALLHPEKVRKLVIVDIAPKLYPHWHTPLLDALTKLDLNAYTSREEVRQALLKDIQNPVMVSFLLKGILIKDGKLTWKFNPFVLKEDYSKIADFPYSDQIFKGPTLWIYGERSHYIEQKDFSTIKSLFPDSTFSEIEDAGHWVHVDNKLAFLEAVETFFRS